MTGRTFPGPKGERTGLRVSVCACQERRRGALASEREALTDQAVVSLAQRTTTAINESMKAEQKGCLTSAVHGTAARLRIGMNMKGIPIV